MYVYTEWGKIDLHFRYCTVLLDVAQIFLPRSVLLPNRRVFLNVEDYFRDRHKATCGGHIDCQGQVQMPQSCASWIGSPMEPELCDNRKKYPCLMAKCDLWPQRSTIWHF